MNTNVDINIDEKEMEKRVEGMCKHVTSISQINTYAKSIIYEAKKDGIDCKQVIERIINNKFFGDNEEIKKKFKNNELIKKNIDTVMVKLQEKINSFTKT